jgi:Tfp pilus assembly protein PilE
MKEESGRSLIEIVGVLAIGTIMIAAAYSIYRSIDNRQKRLIASETIKETAQNIKTMYEFVNPPYVTANITPAQLVADGALAKADTPIGTGWSIAGYNSNTQFKIKIEGLSYDDCNYFAVKKADWADKILVNGSEDGNCNNNNSNIIEFIAH